MNQKNEWDAFRAEVDEKDYAWAACYQKAKKKKKRDFGRIIAITIVCIFFFCWIIDDYFDVDHLWYPSERESYVWYPKEEYEKRLTVKPQVENKDVHCAWAMWEDWGEMDPEDKIRFYIVGKVPQEYDFYEEKDAKVVFDGVEVEQYPICYEKDVLFLDGLEILLSLEKGVQTVSIKVLGNTYTVDLNEVKE